MPRPKLVILRRAHHIQKLIKLHYSVDLGLRYFPALKHMISSEKNVVKLLNKFDVAVCFRTPAAGTSNEKDIEVSDLHVS